MSRSSVGYSRNRYKNKTTFLSLTPVAEIPAEKLIILDDYAFDADELEARAKDDLNSIYKNPHPDDRQQIKDFSDRALKLLKAHPVLGNYVRQFESQLSEQDKHIDEKAVDIVLTGLLNINHALHKYYARGIPDDLPEDVQIEWAKLREELKTKLTPDQSSKVNDYFIQMPTSLGVTVRKRFKDALWGGNLNCIITVQSYLWKFVINMRPDARELIPTELLAKARAQHEVIDRDLHSSSHSQGHFLEDGLSEPRLMLLNLIMASHLSRRLRGPTTLNTILLGDTFEAPSPLQALLSAAFRNENTFYSRLEARNTAREAKSVTSRASSNPYEFNNGRLGLFMSARQANTSSSEAKDNGSTNNSHASLSTTSSASSASSSLRPWGPLLHQPTTSPRIHLSERAGRHVHFALDSDSAVYNRAPTYRPSLTDLDDDSDTDANSFDEFDPVNPFSRYAPMFSQLSGVSSGRLYSSTSSPSASSSSFSTSSRAQASYSSASSTALPLFSRQASTLQTSRTVTSNASASSSNNLFTSQPAQASRAEEDQLPLTQFLLNAGASNWEIGKLFSNQETVINQHRANVRKLLSQVPLMSLLKLNHSNLIRVCEKPEDLLSKQLIEGMSQEVTILKQAIDYALNQYISDWKLSFWGFRWGHHHNERARQVQAAISRCSNLNDIYDIINNQNEIFNLYPTNIPKDISTLLPSRWSRRDQIVNNKNIYQNNGYCRAIEQAHALLKCFYSYDDVAFTIREERIISNARRAGIN